MGKKGLKKNSDNKNPYKGARWDKKMGGKSFVIIQGFFFFSLHPNLTKSQALHKFLDLGNLWGASSDLYRAWDLVKLEGGGARKETHPVCGAFMDTIMLSQLEQPYVLNQCCNLEILQDL